MLMLDSQVHVYERETPERPRFSAGLHGPAAATDQDMIAAMDEAGVDGALLVSALMMYGYDASYALSAFAAFPDRFRVIKPIDPGNPAIGEEIAEWAGTPGAVGARIVLRPDVPGDPDIAGLDRALDAAARHALPVNIMCWDRLDLFADLAARHSDTMLLVDHLGLRQPIFPPAPADPFADLPKLLDLAKFDNVAVKLTGACTLSHQAYPFEDLWAPLERIFAAFGLDRCLWGTDWTRAIELVTYRQAVDAFRLTTRLSDGDKAQLMGGTLARIYGWSPPLRRPSS